MIVPKLSQLLLYTLLHQSFKNQNTIATPNDLATTQNRNHRGNSPGTQQQLPRIPQQVTTQNTLPITPYTLDTSHFTLANTYNTLAIVQNTSNCADHLSKTPNKQHVTPQQPPLNHSIISSPSLSLILFPCISYTHQKLHTTNSSEIYNFLVYSSACALEPYLV